MPLSAVPPPFGFRPATPQDADAVTAVVAAAEQADNHTVDASLEDLLSDWARPSFDLESDTVIITEGTTVVAYAEVFGQRARVHIDPRVRGRGIGTALLAWTEERARSRGVPWIGQTLSERETAARRLLTGHGYVVRWDTWVFQLDLGSRLVDPPPPVPGVTLRTLRRPDDDRAVHEVIETAFNEWPDRDAPMSFDDWRAASLDRPDTDPGLTFVLDDGAQVIGAAVCQRFVDEGWIAQLAVARGHRGQGFGTQLLVTAFTEFRRRGFRTAGLSTDSRTGARDLYERVGMTVARSYARFGRRLD